MSTINPTLRIFAKLDTDKLSREFIETIGSAEGSYEAVDWDLARDLPWTEEVMSSVESFLVVDDEGNVLTEVDTFAKADSVRRSARVTFQVEVDEEAAEA